MKTYKRTALLNHVKFAQELDKLTQTQEEFAEEFDISDRYLRVLKNTDRNISVSLAYAFSTKFNIPIEDLLIIVDKENSPKT